MYYDMRYSMLYAMVYFMLSAMYIIYITEYILANIHSYAGVSKVQNKAPAKRDTSGNVL